MKRILAILVVLFASVLTTACINNFAIQELNNKAKAYMEAGETEKAICRYRSSLDLDASVFETNYNLGVAYIAAKEYEEAADVLKNAIKLNSAVADSYYSLAVALENIAYEKITGENEQTEASDETAAEPEEKELTDKQKEEISQLFMEAIDNYNQYLSHEPTAKDKDKVSAHVEELNKELLNYSVSTEQEKTED